MMAAIFNKDIFEVLTIFSIQPGAKFARKELKEKTKLNNINLDNALTALLNAQLINKEKRLLSINQDNARQIIELISNDYKNLKQLPLNVYFTVTALDFMLSKLKSIDVYLFGSYAKLVFTESSDIDIALISNKIKTKQKKEITNFTQKLESKYGKTIELHYFDKDFYKNKKDPLVKDILKNGVKLIG